MPVPKRKYHKRGELIQGYLTKDHPLYNCYNLMLARCYDENQKSYKNYGGRGIKVCERWMIFKNFAEDMGSKPSKTHTLERVNNDGNYDPDNCKWATRTEQCLNRRRFSNNTTGHTGIVKVKKNGRYSARYDEYGIRCALAGTFATVEEAVSARDNFITLYQTNPQAALPLLERKARYDSSTGIRGISKHQDGGYLVRVTIDGSRKYLGYFKNLNDAIFRMKEFYQWKV